MNREAPLLCRGKGREKRRPLLFSSLSADSILYCIQLLPGGRTGESAGSLEGQERLMETVLWPAGLLRGWEAKGEGLGDRLVTAIITTAEVSRT